ncbi:EAL domain-containing protein [Bacillus sp. FJAT-45350]|uniref:EAL domain-containing protein n=1 Tax=Bacillus sp. FJAT-45350 TaxID=2011014 RepID=UPI000BB78F63|nr:EAL-associated domain-containing protein [Bacillus sp. FJAT-45350]
MDALDVLINKDKIVPFFQPIISAEKQTVVGYEVLGRIETDKGYESLGWFFRDQSIPDEYRIEIDDYLQSEALKKYVDYNTSLYLFLNYDINLLVKDNGETLLSRIEEFRELGVSLKRIVIELREQDFTGNFSLLKHLLVYLQSLGIQIAMDDVGNNVSNLDTIATLKPNIIKVDLDFLEKDALPELYRDVLSSLSLLSRKIGATLLFEGIAQFNQLNYAWRNGGRYYQGFYLGQPKLTFVEPDFCKVTIKKQFQHFINFERKKIEAQLSLADNLDRSLRDTLRKVKSTNMYDEVIMQVAEHLNDMVFRVYICDEEGFQQSSNAIKNENGDWELHPEDRHKNWSWRPYFLETIVRMSYERKGILSDLYTDIEKDEVIRTYSYPIDEQLYLFIDIPYDYLFDKDGLL